MKNIIFKIHKFPKLSETFVVNQIIIALKLGYKPLILIKELGDFKNDVDTLLFNNYGLEGMIEIEDYKIPTLKFSRFFEGILWILNNLHFLPYLIKFYCSKKKYNLHTLYQFIFYSKYCKTDIIHIQFGTNKYPIDVLKKIGFLKGKIIISFHGHDLHFPINGIIPKEGYYDLLFQISHTLVVNTPYLERKLTETEAPVNKIKICPVSVDTEFFCPRENRRENMAMKLITVGRLENLKGQKWGIECVKKLVEMGIEVQYNIIGEGTEEDNLKELISKYKLSSSVFLLGSKSQLEVRNLLESSDVFLMTSITDSLYGAESQGLVSSEAQACGLPIVAFDSGGVKYTLEDGITGFLCEENNLIDYFDKLLRLIRNEDLRKSMGESARLFVEKEFSHKVSLKKWKRIYETDH